MASVLRTLSIHRKRDSNQKTLTVGHLVSASLETIGVGPPSKDTGSSAKRSVVPGPSKLTGKSADSTGAFSYIDSSSTVQSSGSSLGTTGSSSTQFSSTSSSNQQSTNEKAVFDFNAEIFVNLRKEPVSKLTGRVKDISIRPIFEGVYSNVWTGALDGGQKVAIKCLRDQKIRKEKAKRRLIREVGTWWCLNHENIVPLLGTISGDAFGTSPAMISPWYKNGTAAEYLDPKKSVPMSQRVKLFHGVAKGLLYLHTFDVTKIMVNCNLDEPGPCGIKLIHGDLKPLNVLVDDGGVAKICDFGLLRLVREHAPTGMTTTSSHTGTVRYLSYELVSDDPNEAKPTTASDMYALACVGLQFIYSVPPHASIPNKGAHPEFKIMREIEKGKPPALRPENCVGAVSGLWDLFEACWSKEPSKRPDAAVVCRFLEENQEKLVNELEK